MILLNHTNFRQDSDAKWILFGLAPLVFEDYGHIINSNLTNRSRFKNILASSNGHRESGYFAEILNANSEGISIRVCY